MKSRDRLFAILEAKIRYKTETFINLDKLSSQIDVSSQHVLALAAVLKVPLIVAKDAEGNLVFYSSYEGNIQKILEYLLQIQMLLIVGEDEMIPLKKSTSHELIIKNQYEVGSKNFVYLDNSDIIFTTNLSPYS